MSSKEEKIKHIQGLKKEEDIHKLLEELLPNMGFSDVYVTHERGSRPENGKDLICSKMDDIEQKKDWYAFVVKKGKIAGTSIAIDEIRTQTKDCFKYEYKSLMTTSERVRINKVKIVTNFHFSSGAQDKILNDNDIDRANIDFWDAEKLVTLLDKFHPSYWQKGSAAYKKYVEIFIERIREDEFTKKLSLSVPQIQKLIDNAMTPALIERIESSDGEITYKRRNINSVLSIDSNTFIIGEPGSGKSTLFRILSREIIAQNALRNDSEFFPVIITFNQIKDNGFSIEEALNKYFSSETYRTLNIDSQLLIEANKCIIFIDALDEIASNTDKEKALHCIKEFTEKHERIKVICTSRPSDFIYDNCSGGKGFRSLELDKLNRREIEQYINAYFGDNILKSKRLIKSLRDTGLWDRLPKTPLTIALVTIIFDEQEMEIPSTITDLYVLFVDLLLKKLEIKDTSNIMEANIKYRLLSYMAKQMHFEKLVSIPHAGAVSMMKEYLESRGLNFALATQILNDIIDNSGLLYINDKEEIQFKHLSFQEFFTAYELYHHRQKEKETFITHFNNLWWQNVALFYAGFSKDAPLLLDEIIEQSKPKTFPEMINNIAGLGRLMQALYSTPIASRDLGVKRNIETSTKAVNFLIDTDDMKYQFFKNFSRYTIYKLFAGWFNIHHTSITLIEPIKNVFNMQLEEYKNSSIKEESKMLEREFQLFTLASVLANPTFCDFEPYRKLLELSHSNDLSFFALQEMWFRDSYKELTKTQKQLPDVEKIKKTLTNRMRSLGNIERIVNTPLKAIPKKTSD